MKYMVMRAMMITTQIMTATMLIIQSQVLILMLIRSRSKASMRSKNNTGVTRIMNATVQGYRLTNKHGKNNLHDQQQTNGGH